MDLGDPNEELANAAEAPNEVADTVNGYAMRIVASDDLNIKLLAPLGELTDTPRAETPCPTRPGRPANLQIVSADKAHVPPLAGMPDPAQRARILHGAANHELQAVELFAWALVAFPQAPAAMRRGWLRLIEEEQQHCRLFILRLAALGQGFGDYPVSGYFWNKVPGFDTPLHFLCAMCLTFENANLDHSLTYARAAREVGDADTAAVFEQIHADEIQHVRFGWTWLNKLKPTRQSAWQAYCEHLRYPLKPEKARGDDFIAEARRQVGMDEAYIAALAGFK